MRYFLVNCNVGHCGRGNSRDIALAIEAQDLVSALLKAKHFPGVKHHNSAYLLQGKEITQEEYVERIQTSAYEKALRFR